MKQTSIEAYQSIQGGLSKQHFEIYATLLKHPESTAREIGALLGYECWKRMPELVRAGKVFDIGTRPCKITGRKATVYAAFEPESQLRLL